MGEGREERTKDRRREGGRRGLNGSTCLDQVEERSTRGQERGRSKSAKKGKEVDGGREGDGLRRGVARDGNIFSESEFLRVCRTAFLSCSPSLPFLTSNDDSTSNSSLLSSLPLSLSLSSSQWFSSFLNTSPFRESLFSSLFLLQTKKKRRTKHELTFLSLLPPFLRSSPLLPATSGPK